MRYLMLALLLVSLMSESLAQQSLVGTYKLVSHVRDVKGSGPIQNMGNSPRGHMMISPKHLIVFFTAEIRKPGTSLAEKAALYDTLTAYSGPYRVEGSKLILNTEVSSNARFRTNELRHIAWSGNRLTLTTDSRPSGRDPSETVVIRQVWEKVE